MQNYRGLTGAKSASVLYTIAFGILLLLTLLSCAKSGDTKSMDVQRSKDFLEGNFLRSTSLREYYHKGGIWKAVYRQYMQTNTEGKWWIVEKENNNVAVCIEISNNPEIPSISGKIICRRIDLDLDRQRAKITYLFDDNITMNLAVEEIP